MLSRVAVAMQRPPPSLPPAVCLRPKLYRGSSDRLAGAVDDHGRQLDERVARGRGRELEHRLDRLLRLHGRQVFGPPDAVAASHQLQRLPQRNKSWEYLSVSDETERESSPMIALSKGRHLVNRPATIVEPQASQRLRVNIEGASMTALSRGQTSCEHGSRGICCRTTNPPTR
jgi:hypothetical protein